MNIVLGGYLIFVFSLQSYIYAVYLSEFYILYIDTLCVNTVWLRIFIWRDRKLYISSYWRSTPKLIRGIIENYAAALDKDQFTSAFRTYFVRKKGTKVLTAQANICHAARDKAIF